MSQRDVKRNMSRWPRASVPRSLVFCQLSHTAFFSPLQEYEGDAREFKLKVDDTERRLGAIFCQAFEDASGLEHAFKVWDINLSLRLSPAHKDIHTLISPRPYLMFAGSGYVW